MKNFEIKYCDKTDMFIIKLKGRKSYVDSYIQARELVSKAQAKEIK